MKRIVLSTLILLVAAGTVCAQKKASKKKVAKKAKTEAAAPVKIAPDTVSVKDFSYCLGVANSNGLKQYLQQQLRIDTAQYMDDFLRGFKEAANDPTNAKMKAYAAGLQIADQVMNQMLPQANKQITDNRDSAFVNQAEFLRGFLEATTNSGSVTVRKPGDYVAKAIELAGGTYAFRDLKADENAQATTTLQMEAFYTGAKDADILIYNSTIEGELTTIDQLLNKSPLLADFQAVKAGNVWCTGKNLFQESLGLGDMMVDFHTIFTDPSVSDDALTYLHRLT